MTLVEVVEENPVPHSGCLKDNPQKAALYKAVFVREETHANRGGRGPASASLFLY